MKCLLFFLFIITPLNCCFALDIGVVADIHAGKQRKRDTGTNVLYPRKGVGYFEKAVKRMRGKVDLIVALGDNTNNGEIKYYYKKLRKVENKCKIPILWVKGNHDGKNFRYLSTANNYYRDFDNVRIIVLDTNSGYKNANGGIIPEGLELYNQAVQDR